MDSHEHLVLLDLGCRTSGFRSTPAGHVPWSCRHVSPSINQHLWRPKSADADHSHYKLITGCVTHWYVILTFLRWLECSNKTTRSRCSSHQQSAEALNRHTTNPPLFLNRKNQTVFCKLQNQKPTPPSSIVRHFCSNQKGRNVEAKMDPESRREALLHWS